MGLWLRLLITALVVIGVMATSSLIIKYVLTPRHVIILQNFLQIIPPPSPLVLPVSYNVSYGLLFCYGIYAAIPGNSMIILYYRPHGDVEINNVIIFMAFPANIINKTLNALSKLPNPRYSMIIGVYVNGRLIAVDNSSEPVLDLEAAVSQRYFWQLLKAGGELSWFVVSFPAINLTQNDTVAIVIYSVVPYTLPSCNAPNEAEVANLLMRNSYEDGNYIVEEPVVYMIRVSEPMQGLPQELPTGAKPFITGIAPSYTMGLT